MEKEDTVVTIQCLPEEIITLILINNKPEEIIKFSLTCKQLYNSVCNNDYLWKMKYSENVPRIMLKVVKNNCDSEWRKEFIHLCKVRKKVYSELLSMSPKFYGQKNPVPVLEDVRPFFSIATKNSVNYYYVIYLLQDIIRKGNDYLNSCICSKPLYTMTVMFYSKIVLRYLMQTYLAIQWVQLHMKNKLTPEKVITFFLQWIDPTKIYDLTVVEKRIQELVKKVDDYLKRISKNEKFAVQVYTEKQVLEAISQVIYKHEHFFVAYNMDTNNLDVAKVIQDSHGNIITFGAIYQAVAERFGINCELKVFPNHFFLNWRNNEEPNKPLYSVDLLTGDLKPKQGCPFADYSRSSSSNTKYCAESFLKYIYSAYTNLKPLYRQTHNSEHLLDFLGTSESKYNPYKHFLSYIVENCGSPAMEENINLYFMDESHREMLLTLSSLNNSPQEVDQKVLVKKYRTMDVPIFAVGMICYHSLHHYACVIRDWEVNGLQLNLHSVHYLQHGTNQPFYWVSAVDQMERLIAHEHLTPVRTPIRIYLLEDRIARDFTHFDGFYYVPNDEKLAEYPNEIVIAEAFRNRYGVNQ